MMKFSKAIYLILALALVFTFLVGCDENSGPFTLTGPTPSQPTVISHPTPSASSNTNSAESISLKGETFVFSEYTVDNVPTDYLYPEEYFEFTTDNSGYFFDGTSKLNLTYSINNRDINIIIEFGDDSNTPITYRIYSDHLVHRKSWPKLDADGIEIPGETETITISYKRK